VFKVTPRQNQALELLTNTAKHIMLEGGSRSGKTALLVYAIIIRALKVKSRHLITRFRFNAVNRSIWLDTLPKVLSLIDPTLKSDKYFNKSDYFYKCPNGSEIWIAGTDDKERIEKVLGMEFSTIFFNECSQILYSAVSIFRTRLAEKNTLQKKFYYDQNPPKKSHWTYKVFHEYIDPMDKRKLDKNRYTSLVMNPTDNLDNIAEGFIEELELLPERQRKRFLKGLYGEDDAGEVFKTNWIQRIYEIETYSKIVISIDPAVTANKNSDETGITVQAKVGDFGYVLEAIAGKWTPNEWGMKAVELYVKWSANIIIGEANNGGDMIEAVLRNILQNIPYKKVHATKGKVIRAEPIAGLYERKKIFHYGMITNLEDEMDDFTYDFDRSKHKSPNLVDAMVWGFTYLFPPNRKEPTLVIPVSSQSKSTWSGV